MNFPVRNSKSKKLQKETNNKFPDSPKPKSKNQIEGEKEPIKKRCCI